MGGQHRQQGPQVQPVPPPALHSPTGSSIPRPAPPHPSPRHLPLPPPAPQHPHPHPLSPSPAPAAARGSAALPHPPPCRAPPAPPPAAPRWRPCAAPCPAAPAGRPAGGGQGDRGAGGQAVVWSAGHPRRAAARETCVLLWRGKQVCCWRLSPGQLPPLCQPPSQPPASPQPPRPASPRYHPAGPSPRQPPPTASFSMMALALATSADASAALASWPCAASLSSPARASTWRSEACGQGGGQPGGWQPAVGACAGCGAGPHSLPAAHWAMPRGQDGTGEEQHQPMAGLLDKGRPQGGQARPGRHLPSSRRQAAAGARRPGRQEAPHLHVSQPLRLLRPQLLLPRHLVLQRRHLHQGRGRHISPR